MVKEVKFTVSKEETFDKLEIRVGRILSVELETSAPKNSYKLEIDFGKFGKKISVGRFTQHSEEELKGKLVVAVLNFEPRHIGNTLSEVLVLGVQYPKADSGEATIITPLAETKIGGKLF
ncbi:MAG: tRNA-binding protein [Hapalosiphonaceae cyanobacterium JJU2]|nr:MAG: tRNA-binding protein [Hapalosiphonaceae cyanobacterium JJU2]